MTPPSNVINLGYDGRRIYPRRLFTCETCGSAMFKLHRTDGELMVECANCEAFIDFEDLEV